MMLMPFASTGVQLEFLMTNVAVHAARRWKAIGLL